MSTPDVDPRIRRLGRTELDVSEFGLGCARLGGIFKQDPREFIRILSTALDGGINFFDTADIYTQGESEMLIGRAFRGRRRDEIVIASKAGYILPSRRYLIARVKPLVRPVIRWLGLKRRSVAGAVSGTLAQDFSPRHLRQAVEGSLRRLRTDRIDLFQLHSPPADVVADGGWEAILAALKAEGKIRYYGISCDTIDAALAALRFPGVAALQVPVSLLERSFLSVLERAKEQGVGVVARECLANGLLAKEVSTIDVRTYTRSEAEAVDKLRQIALLGKQAAADATPLSQFALRFVSALPAVSVSLVGVSRMQQLEALLLHRRRP